MRFLLIGLLLTCVLGCQANQTPGSATDDLVGEVSSQQLLAAYPAFQAEYERYMPSVAELEAVKQLQGTTMTVLFGIWCHDSVREVPRLLKVIDVAKVSHIDLRLIAVNQQKQEPTGLFRRLNLRYTPTFILFDGEEEMGRVIEKPLKSLGQDLSDLIRHN